MNNLSSPAIAKGIFDGVFPSNVTAFVTDASMDFAYPADHYELTPAQQGYLRRTLGVEVWPGGSIHQVHEAKVVIADPKIRQVVDADAIITDVKNFAITVRTADCLSVFIHDPVHQAVGLAHAGWKGTHDRIAVQTLEAMTKRYGTLADQVVIAFGPCIRAEAYEVGPEFKTYFPEDVKEVNGKYHFDNAAANRQQLLAAGVQPENIHDCGICTFSNDNYFSFRRQGQSAGRMLSGMMIQ